MPGTPEQILEPAPIHIYGGNQESRLLARVAETRDDVEIEQVTLALDDRISPSQYLDLASRSSVYGRQEISLDQDQVTPRSAAIIEIPYTTSLVVTSPGEPRFGLSPVYKLPETTMRGSKETLPDMGATLFTVPPHTLPSNGDVLLNPVTLLPAFFESGERRDPHPHYVPQGLAQVALPLLKALNQEAGVTHASIVNIASYSDAQALTDQAKDSDVANMSRAGAQGSLLVPTNAVEYARYFADRYSRRSEYNLFGRLTVSEISIPIAVGSRAMFSVGIQDRFEAKELVDNAVLGYTDYGVDIEPDPLSSQDVLGSDRALIERDSIRANDQLLTFSLLYDAGWIRACRILDSAREIFVSRIRAEQDAASSA